MTVYDVYFLSEELGLGTKTQQTTLAGQRPGPATPSHKALHCSDRNKLLRAPFLVSSNGLDELVTEEGVWGSGRGL